MVDIRAHQFVAQASRSKQVRLLDRIRMGTIVRVLVALLASGVGGCSEDGNFDVPEAIETSASPSVTPVVDRVASCDQALDGTPCGAPNSDEHCLYSACVENTCGDGIRAHFEDCDDGDQVDGDGCNSACLREECGNGRLDPGEACDDGNLEDGDACTSACVLGVGPSPEPPVDAGLPLAPSCPRLLDLTATPTAARPFEAIGLQATLNNVKPETLRWMSGGGEFASQAAATTFACGDETGVYELRLLLATPGCPPSGAAVLVECLPPRLPVDASIPSGGGSAVPDAQTDLPDASSGGAGDAGGTLTDAGTSSGDTSDAGEPSTDAGTGSGGALISGLSDPCAQCVLDKCQDYLGQIDLAGPCFLGTSGAAHADSCRAAFECAVKSTDNCGFNQVRGPVGCYCGEDNTVANCQSDPSSVQGECIDAFEAATDCVGSTASGNSSCVLDRFIELGRPSAEAVFGIECMFNQCGRECPVSVQQ